MTDQLFHRVKTAIAACSEHGSLPHEEFTDYAQEITKEIHRKQSAVISLLPSVIAKEIR